MSNIVLLGLVSLFTDISTEMVYPILPLYLSAVMGAGPAIIGVIEGIAESIASIIKLFSGIVADKYGNKKRLAFAGYASSTINKIIILFAASWVGVLLARIVDRFGKGIRTAPRDALVAESAGKADRGKAFGLHKGLDLLGTAIGIMLAWLILSGFIFSGSTLGTYKTIFIVSMVPAVIGLVVLAFVKDKKIKRVDKPVSFNWKNLNIRLKLFLVFIFLFTLGHFSNAFVILRAVDAGFSKTNAILLHFIYNMTGSLMSFPAGILSDRFGRKNILCTGYFLYGVVFLGMALTVNGTAFIALFVIYGLYEALTAGVERALIVDIVPEQHKAGALGLHSAVVGIGLLPASVIAGILWERLGPSAPFIFGGTMAFVTCIAVFVILSLKPGRDPETERAAAA